MDFICINVIESTLQYVVGSSDGLAPQKWQAIRWTSVDQVL